MPLTGPTPSSAANCTSPKSYTGLADGSYTFSVYAVDAANNADPSPATWTFTVAVVPDTTIDSAVDGANTPIANGGTTPTDSMTFTFSGTDNNPSSDLTFTCELTGPSAVPADTDCDPTGTTFTGLLDGDYTFSVYAVDAANNADPSPATWTFTVAVVPDTTIDSAVDGANTTIANGGTTPTDSMTFTFSGSDNNPSSELTFTCELTGPSAVPADTDCDPTGTTFTGLLDGDYTFSVYAVDAANNADPSPATWTFTVAVVPDTTIDSAVDGANTPIANGGTTPTDSMTFTFSGPTIIHQVS